MPRKNVTRSNPKPVYTYFFGHFGGDFPGNSACLFGCAALTLVLELLSGLSYTSALYINTIRGIQSKQQKKGYTFDLSFKFPCCALFNFKFWPNLRFVSKFLHYGWRITDPTCCRPVYYFFFFFLGVFFLNSPVYSSSILIKRDPSLLGWSDSRRPSTCEDIFPPN